ncbi:hypothetical protein ACFLX6_02195 [Chloroflexota bacterium]
MKEKVEVVWPLGKFVKSLQPLVSRLDTLDGKTICGLYNGDFYFDKTWQLIQQLLMRKYAGIKFVGWEEFSIVSDKEQVVVLKALPDKLKKYNCDAVISGRGC